MLTFVAAVTDEKAENRRFVFDLGNGFAVVVKTFGEGAKPTTAKVWDLSRSSLKKTMSYWTTNVPLEVSSEEKEAARATAVRLCSMVR